MTSLYTLLLVALCLSATQTLASYALNTNGICRKSRVMNGSKQDMCQDQPELVREVAIGNSMAVRECQINFAHRKWNCTTSHRTFKKILKTDTREAAYLNAITAAGVLHSVTTACSTGVLWQCHCDRTQRDVANDGLWEWGGCSDDVEFGYNKSKQFTDIKKERYDIKALLLVHNNEAGRLTIMNNMRRACKCHGLSGSCGLQTCWRKMPHFSLIGQKLKDKYDGSPKVTGNNDGYSLIPEANSIKPPSDMDLVYTNDSPNFCKPNNKFGTPGTVGRICNGTSMGPDGCDILCCGRGSTKQTFSVKEKCRCRFVWCCEVICHMCIVQKTIHTCK